MGEGSAEGNGTPEGRAAIELGDRVGMAAIAAAAHAVHRRTEAIQTAAMALRFLMSLDAGRYDWTRGQQHSQRD